MTEELTVIRITIEGARCYSVSSSDSNHPVLNIKTTERSRFPDITWIAKKNMDGMGLTKTLDDDESFYVYEGSVNDFIGKRYFFSELQSGVDLVFDRAYSPKQLWEAKATWEAACEDSKVLGALESPFRDRDLQTLFQVALAFGRSNSPSILDAFWAALRPVYKVDGSVIPPRNPAFHPEFSL